MIEHRPSEQREESFCERKAPNMLKNSTISVESCGAAQVDYIYIFLQGVVERRDGSADLIAKCESRMC